MWELSTRVFGKSFFSYEMLASAAHEVNLKLVKLAVKRLEIISRHEYIKPDNDNQPQKSTNLEFEDKFSSSINYNANGWQWEYSENANNRKCNFYSYNKLKDRIDNLSEPIIKP